MSELANAAAASQAAGAQGGGDSGAGNQGGAAQGGAASSGGAGAASGGGQQGASGGQASGSWLDSLSPEHREAAEIKGFKTPDDLAKSYIHAQKLIGADKIVVPGKNATDEDWMNAFKKLGLPESPDKYEFQLDAQHKPEDVKGFKEFAHKTGILPKQAEALYKFDLERQQQAQQQMEQKRSEMIKSGLDNLKKEWGEQKYDEHLHQSAKALETFFGKEYLEWADKCGVGDDPMFIKMMHKVSSAMGEDTLKGTGGVSFGESKGAIMEKINSVMGNMSHPYWNSAHPGHKAAVEEMRGLQEQAARAK